MKNKNYIFSVIFFLSIFASFISAAYAQEFRLIQGFNLSIYSIHPDEYVSTFIPPVVLDLKSNFLAGLLIGGGIEFDISKNITVGIDALYFQKGSIIIADEVIISNYDLNELSFPILIKIKPSSGFPAYLLGGGELSFIITHEVDGTNITEDAKTLDYGLVTGGGVEIKLKNSTVYLEGRYHLGLKNITKATIWPWQFESIKPNAIVLLWGIKI